MEKDVTFQMNNMFTTLTDIELANVNNNYRYHVPVRYRKYTKEDILRFMKNPEADAKQLRDASIYLYAISTQYRRVINYFAMLYIRLSLMSQRKTQRLSSLHIKKRVIIWKYLICNTKCVRFL